MRVIVASCAFVPLVCASLLCVAFWGDAMGTGEAPLLVNCSDIPKKVKLIGRFGLPLGEKMIKIRGKWKERPSRKGDYDELVFFVYSVNGRTIKAPVEIPLGLVRSLTNRGRVVVGSDGERTWVADWTKGKEDRPAALAGDEWEMRGYEAGRTVGCPLEITVISEGVQDATDPGEFVVDFWFATARVFAKPPEPSKTGSTEKP